MRTAIIDLGTNTFHLWIADKISNTITTVFKKQIAVKLGEGGINKGIIAPDAFERGILALLEFSADILLYEVENTLAIATSAIRSAENGEEFMQQALEQTGITIQPIDGNTEARLIFEGVKNSIDITGESYLVMDIGGGSVEFIIGSNNDILWKGSFEIGCARLVEKFHRNDPIAPDEVTALRSYLTEQLQPLFVAGHQHAINRLVGAAGSFESVADLVADLSGKDTFLPGENHCAIDLPDFQDIYHSLLTSTYREREKMRGLADYRVEMIVVAAILIDLVIQELGITRLYCSAFSLKEGVLFSLS